MNLKKFELIKQEYEEYYNSFLKQGKLPLGTTSKGFWGAAVAEEVLELFDKINLRNYKNFIDLGSGDGKVVLIASLFGTKAVGVEFDKDLFNKSIEIKNRLNIKNCGFHNDDYFNVGITHYDVVFVNPDAPFSRGLENKLIKEMKGILIVYGEQFKPKSLRHKEQFFIDGTEVNIYSNKTP